jgi:hypothetical protein
MSAPTSEEGTRIEKRALFGGCGGQLGLAWPRERFGVAPERRALPPAQGCFCFYLVMVIGSVFVALVEPSGLVTVTVVATVAGFVLLATFQLYWN